ncbi:DoxX family protein [Puniceicoccales bacterium CK1056]|uniref:DoxX family protein n=1 Tax=Oceanipulchritudo coccoides TaxID=2706888 RepID=A0A6B2M1I4_9BACT|nr:DoxX family protein [Oceanipulchritudo coccoides]NDV62788.1 DoxX family protein [Oceanipulchritudo coccoides]
MNSINIILQVIIALGILNVWFLRFNTASEWRGGKAKNMREEFDAYGLPEAVMYIVGFLKVLCAVLLLVGIWAPAFVTPAAGILAVLMLGAIVMHFKIGDPPKKSLPAGTVLLLCLVLAIL